MKNNFPIKCLGIVAFIFLFGYCHGQQAVYSSYIGQNLGFGSRTVGCPDLNNSIPNRTIHVLPKPNLNLQFLVDSLHKLGGGTILLRSGTYPLSKTLSIKSNIRIKGENRNTVILTSAIKSAWLDDSHNAAIIRFRKTTNASFENVSIVYTGNSNPPIDLEDPLKPWDKGIYQNDPYGDTNLYVSGIVMEGAKNCSITKCRILNSGTDPVFIQYSENITLAYNYIDRCYNKGGEGNGYYVLRKNSARILVFADTVRRIRHFTIEQGANHNVVSNCEFAVDINFHNGDNGYNIIQNNNIKLPLWHGWNCFATGVRNMHAPPGPKNLLYKNRCFFRCSFPEFNLNDSAKTYNGFAGFKSVVMPVVPATIKIR